MIVISAKASRINGICKISIIAETVSGQRYQITILNGSIRSRRIYPC